jgi:4-hydroxy-2-oxoheptanedioate aldolase
MPAPHNSLKSALSEGRLQKGLWLNLSSPLVAEMAGLAGFDWCLIDGEHGPWDPAGIRDQLIALEGTRAAPVIRVPCDEPWVLKQVLDLGVQTVLVPMVHSAAQADAVVRGLRYPPAGIRGHGAMVARAGGFGRITGYAATADVQICCLVQAESRAALDDIDAIAATDGVDGVFIGPADLAADMGHVTNPDHPKVRAAIAAAIPRILGQGKAAGIICAATDFAHYIDLGVTFLGLGSDAMILQVGLNALAKGMAHDPG